MGHNLTIALLSGILGCLAGHSVAATDGTPGQTSQGSLQISLHVKPQVRLSNLQDLGLISDGLQRVSASTELCIYARTGQYQMRAQGSGAGKGFTLSQAGHTEKRFQRTYQVQYDDGSGFKSITSGESLGGLSGADTQSLSCSTTGLNGHLLVSSSPISGQLQQSGLYTGTLTLLLAPE